MPRLAALFFQQADVGDHHATIDGLAHVVDGEQGGAIYLNQLETHSSVFCLCPSKIALIWTEFGQDFSPIVWAMSFYSL